METKYTLEKHIRAKKKRSTKRVETKYTSSSLCRFLLDRVSKTDAFFEPQHFFRPTDRSDFDLEELQLALTEQSPSSSSDEETTITGLFLIDPTINTNY